MKKPVSSVAVAAEAVREATTGNTVLQRVWAVGEAPAEARALTVAGPVRTAPKRPPQPELAFYRKYTEAMLRRYLRMATESGRVPSMLGRELFRSRVTSYQVHSFEDVVIFCIDVERCLDKLDLDQRHIIKRIALQEYTQSEAAMMLGLSLRDTVRKYAAALDRLTGIFLAAGLLEKLRSGV